jgi:glycosyltransferase involved in cell wall biosynthesis
VNSPVISVLLLNYNYGRYLKEAVKSVREQTFRGFELIIADDGSTDESLPLYRELTDHRTQVIRGDHVGLGGNVLRSLPHCTREFLAITSADDRWLPDHLEAAIQSLSANPSAALAYSTMRQIDSEGRSLGSEQKIRHSDFPSGWVAVESLLPSQFIPTQTTLFRRAVVDEVGGIDPKLKLLELDLILRIVRRYPVVYTGRTTGEYRVHSKSMSRDVEEMLQARLDLYDKHFGLAMSKKKRKFVAEAYMRTAYRELVDNPTRDQVDQARKHILRAFRIDHAGTLRPLSAAMLAASLSGRLHVWMYPRFERRFGRSPIKLALRRLVGVRRRPRFARLS